MAPGLGRRVRKGGMRLRANRRILDALERALRAARREKCAVDKVAQEAMRLYLDTWVVAPLQAAIDEMKGVDPENATANRSDRR